jgi:hypothetical protein
MIRAAGYTTTPAMAAWEALIRTRLKRSKIAVFKTEQMAKALGPIRDRPARES